MGHAVCAVCTMGHAVCTMGHAVCAMGHAVCAMGHAVCTCNLLIQNRIGVPLPRGLLHRKVCRTRGGFISVFLSGAR